MMFCDIMNPENKIEILANKKSNFLHAKQSLCYIEWEFKSRFNSNPKFVGVFQQRNKRYRAQIEHNGKTKSKRNFSSREAAARWFDEKRKKLNKNKDGLILNFPRNGRNDTVTNFKTKPKFAVSNDKH
jgi:hypothetical protein